MPAMSKAQQFALKAEAIGGWTVERKHDKELRTRAVTVTRGSESFGFGWVRNENDRDNFAFGVHTVDGHVEEFSNVREALRQMAKPEGTARVISRPASVKRNAGENKRIPEQPRTQIVRLPFDPYVSSANEIVESVRGARVTWINSMSGAEEEGVCLREAKQIKVEHLEKDLDDWSRRILTFCSEDGFRSVRLCAILEVK